MPVSLQPNTLLSFLSQESAGKKMRGNLIPLFCLIIFLQYFPLGNSDSPLAPGLYVLGDSLLDSGNNNFLPTLARANFNPYGVNFPTGATGRFTNGRTVADFIAEFLGLPLPPPYMSFRRSGTGLNYASGSCGILPETGNYIGKCLNLDDQIDLFEQTVTVDLPKHHQSKEKVSDYLSNSIFLVSVGSNDYINNYLQPNIYATSKRYSPHSFAQLLSTSLSYKFERLYKLGAKKVVMFEIGPVGCIPSITGQYIHDGQCVEEINQFVSLFNNQLPTMLHNLTSSLPGSAFVLGHVHWLGYDAVKHPSAYGLTETSNPCCITWANGTSGCIPGLEPCTTIDKHLFWDGYHLTQAVYSVIASHCIHNSSVCIPKSIKELVQT
ncbi:GDSL esterase/lipase 7-like [Actinidia eriantha]|uniref:GDSL esterase/lipase 7-like n=1 Tax=Actinidia eriantha TaxID=165200 RepID=UPI0025845D01|nr:GDSL esterase/lipase 7-like [Actinidia eriantha]